MLRDLWRFRLYVLGVSVLAVLAGLTVMYKVSLPPKFESRAYDVGVATAHILVDTPRSQLVEVAPTGVGTLGMNTELLASLMIDGLIKSDIAHRAGLQPDQIVGVTDAATVPSAAGPSPVSAPSGPRAFVLTTQVMTDIAGDNLPIIEISAQAPNRNAALRLADAAIAGLGDYLVAKAAQERVPKSDRLQVTGLGQPQATTETHGPSDVIAIVAVILVFGFGCACILAVQALVRGWRAASARELLGDGELAREQTDDEPSDWEVRPASDELLGAAGPTVRPEWTSNRPPRTGPHTNSRPATHG